MKEDNESGKLWRDVVPANACYRYGLNARNSKNHTKKNINFITSSHESK